MSLADDLDMQRRADAELEKAWTLGEYVGVCPNCHRDRLCRCSNGKRRCEKCNWVPEDNDYAPVR